MAGKKKRAKAGGEVLADAKETAAIERHWRVAGRPKARKPPKHYKYIEELAHLQVELIKLQEWVRVQGLKVAVIFEGRDAAGKGGVIKRISESLNPRICRIVALGTPTERERSQWYFQRYVPHLPAAGEIALFDRSWYNRAGVEHVMGFCTDAEHAEFLRSCPLFEEMLKIEPPLPAVSRPSNSTRTRCPVSSTQRAISPSSSIRGFCRTSYSSHVSSAIHATSPRRGVILSAHAPIPTQLCPAAWRSRRRPRD